MARLTIDTGTLGNPATGDTLRTAMTKANDNFLELYTDLAGTTSSGGFLTNPTTNGDVKIQANGTGIVEIDRLSISNTAISSLDTNADITLTANGTGTVKVIGNLTLDDSDEIKLGDAGDLRIFHNGSHSIIREDGTGSLYLQSDNNVILSKDTSTEIMVKAIADGAVELYHNNVKKFNTGSHGIDIVDELHTEGATPHLTLKRTNNANVPTLRFKGSGGTVNASVGLDGTSGTNNEVFVKTYDGSSLAERFRVGHTKTSVAGHLEVSGAQVDFTALPTSDPGVAGRLFRSGNDVKISTG